MEEEKAISLNEQIKQTIKQNLVLLRKANDLKMRDVAAALGIKENTYRVWEEPDKSCPKQIELVRIAKMYGVSLDLLMTGKADGDGRLSLSVQAPKLDNEVYGEQLLRDLSRYEKILVMKIRQMNTADRNKVNELVEEICSQFDK